MRSNDIFSLRGMTALVTGSTGYLGKEMATGLAEMGAKVILQGRDSAKVKELFLELKNQSFDVETAVFDLASEDEIKKYFGTFPHEKLDVLVNNAYSGSAGSLAGSSPKQFQEAYQISVVAAAMMTKYALPFMKSTDNENKSIINIASMYGIVSPDLSIYSNESEFNPPFYGAAKAGLIQLSKYSAVELAKYGIRVNTISPGAFPGTAAQMNEKLISGIKARNVMGRIGLPQELKGPLIFLASKASSYVTGANLVVDGGWTIR